MDQNTHAKSLRGLPAAPGLAAGPVFVWQDSDLTLPAPYACKDPEEAWGRIRSAIDRAKQEIGRMREKVLQRAGKEEAAIFDAHVMMVEDVALHEMVQASLKEGVNPEAAWSQAVESFARMLEGISDPTLSARAADVRDVGKRVLAQLLGRPSVENEIREPSIVLARDLAPSQTVTMDHRLVLAFCTAQGGPTSHTAILAKALGLPAIVAMGSAILDLAPGDFVLVDAAAGEVIVNPDEAQRKAFGRRVQAAGELAGHDLQAAAKEAVTRDGFQPEVVANIGGIEDARNAIEHGAEGVGLFRTEFIYLNRKSMPSAEEQAEVYRQVIEALGGRPLVVRTLDIGGDKTVDYLGILQEPNPFLGWRGIRTVKEKPELLRDQFVSLLKAGQGTDLRIMVPMVADVGEVQQAHELLDEALHQVQSEIPGYSARLQFGIMVEVPSAALMIEQIAPFVDFFSIGTNDLTQYTLAVDRTNARVAALASPFHPAVLKLIAQTVRAAHQEGKWVGMCGELAGEGLAVPFLLGVGLDEFSMSAAAIPAVKRIIRQLSTRDCKVVAEHALKLATAPDVQVYLQAELDRLIS